MQVPWSIAKVLLNAGNEAIHALRAYVVLAEISDTAIATRDDFYQAYRNLGISRTTARKDLASVLRPRTIEGHGTILAEHTTESESRILRRSMLKIAQDLGVRHLGFIAVTAEDVADFHQFKRVLTECVLFGRNRDTRGGVTVSYEGMSKLVGLSTRQLKRTLKRMDVIKQTNYAEVVMPNAKDNKRAAAKYYKQRLLRTPDREAIIRIRNTYYSPRIGLQTRTDNYRPIGTPASASAHLRPEYDEWVLRQVWTDEMPSYDLVSDLIADVDIDIRLGEAVLSTGELVGLFVKLIGGGEYSPKELRSVLWSAQNVDRPALRHSPERIDVRA